MSRPDPETLHELDDAEFERFVRSFVGTTWDGWTADVSPPSPDHDVAARLSRAGERRVFHAKQRRADSPVGESAVRELATIRDQRDFEGVTLATTGGVSESARSVAAERGVGVLDSDAWCRLCDELGIELFDAVDTVSADVDDPGIARLDIEPDAGGRHPETDLAWDLHQTVETYAANWSASLRERATAVLAAVDGLAAFEHQVAIGDASTVVTFAIEEGAYPVVKTRLGETNFLVYVRTPGGEFEGIVQLSVHRENQPAPAELLADLEPRIERALERRT